MSKRLHTIIRPVALIAMPIIVAGSVLLVSNSVKNARNADAQLASTISETYVLGDTVSKPFISVLDPIYDADKGEFAVIVTINNPLNSALIVKPSQFSIVDNNQSVMPVTVPGQKTMTITEINPNGPMTARLVFKTTSQPKELFFTGADGVKQTISL